jgi:hypothetical protein
MRISTFCVVSSTLAVLALSANGASAGSSSHGGGGGASKTGTGGATSTAKKPENQTTVRHNICNTILQTQMCRRIR